MNIFTALTKGNGRLQEPNISSLLAFFLNPHETHNLNNTFLNEFILAIFDHIGEDIDDRFVKSVKVDLEESVKYDPHLPPRYIDIVVRLNGENNKGQYVIAIENKINEGAADTTQFHQEFIGIEEKVKDPSTKIIMVFLTPDVDSKLLKEEFDALDENTLGSHKKLWMKWMDNGKSIGNNIQEYYTLNEFVEDMKNRATNSVTKDELLTISQPVLRTFGHMLLNSGSIYTNQPTVVEIFRRVLTMESQGRLDPISDYVKYTIKSFISFVESNINVWLYSQHNDYRKVYCGIPVNGTLYNLILKDNFFIEETDTLQIVAGKERTREILIQIINNEKLSISTIYPSGGKKNIDQLGKEILNAIMGVEPIYAEYHTKR